MQEAQLLAAYCAASSELVLPRTVERFESCQVRGWRPHYISFAGQRFGERSFVILAVYLEALPLHAYLDDRLGWHNNSIP